MINTFYVTGQGTDAQDSDPDSDIIIREVNHLSKTLMFNSSLTTEEKEEIVSKIGHMAYMGMLCLFYSSSDILFRMKSKSTSKVCYFDCYGFVERCQSNE